MYEPRSAVFHSHGRSTIFDLLRYYVDQRVLRELFGLEFVPSLACLFLAIFRFSAQLYRLLYRDEEMAAKGVLWLMLIALKYAVPAQVGNYLGAKSGSIARLSPRAFGKLHCF